MNLGKTLRESLSIKEGSDRSNYISELRDLGCNYNFDKYSDQQLYCIWKKAKAKKEKDFDALEAESSEEIKTCPKCGSPLNDGSTCPKCDDGEEDESLDEAKESASTGLDLKATRAERPSSQELPNNMGINLSSVKDVNITKQNDGQIKNVDINFISDKMKVYVVITRKNGEFKGEVKGFYEAYEDARNRYEEIKEDWERWAEGDKIETDETLDHTFYCMTNFSQEEYMEVQIIEKELTRREKPWQKQKKVNNHDEVKEYNESLNSVHNNDMVEINNGYYLVYSPDHEINQDKTVHLINLNGVKHTVSLEKFNKEARLVDPEEAKHIAKFHNTRKINNFKEDTAINNHDEVKEYNESLSSNTNPDKKNSKIEKHTGLNPILWDNNEELKPEVKGKFLKIVKAFKDCLKEDGVELKDKDVVIIGSNASYNYTDQSDIDLHIIADTKDEKDPLNLLPIIFNSYKSRFNDKHDINIKGHEVEVYVEPNDINAKSNGIYSLNTGWIKKPAKEDIPDMDEKAFDKLFTEWEDKYFDLLSKVGEDNSNNGQCKR